MPKWVKVDNVVSFDDSTIETLKTFGSSPAGFIFGIVLTPLLNGFETVVLRTLDLVNLVFYGDFRSSTYGMLGLADIPTESARILVQAGNIVGDPIVNDIFGPIGDMLAALAAWAGPYGLLGAAIALVVLANVFSETIRLAIEVVLDIIPGGGALIN